MHYRRFLLIGWLCLSNGFLLAQNADSTLVVSDVLADTIAVEEEILPDSVACDSLSIDSLAQYLNPAAELYRFSWTSERINPYGVKIDSIPDSTSIDISDFVYPLESNRITSRFGQRGYRWHYGNDIGVNIGDTIRSTFAGRVRIVDYERRGYGRYVVIRHNNGLETVYAHLSRALCVINQDVKAGEAIGLGGNTGRSTGPHLHYEIRFLGNAFNPSKLVDFQEKIAVSDSTFLITLAETYSHNAALKELMKAKFHTVRSGDTLSGIAHRYGTTVSRLCKLNGISSKKILRIGQKIRYR